MNARVLIALGALAIGGCVLDAEEDAFVQLPEADPETASGDAAAVLTELVAPGGATLRFIDESVSAPGAAVGVLEIAGPGDASFLGALQDLTGATPLEIFLAAGGSTPPPALVADHRARARRDPQPASLAKSFEVSSCPSTSEPGDGFHAWFITHDPGTSAHGHGWDLTGDLDGVTGSSETRALGACVPDLVCTPFLDCDGGVGSIHVQVGPGLWFLVNGTKTPMPPNRSIFYYSSGYSVTRYKISMRDMGVLPYHLEGSW